MTLRSTSICGVWFLGGLVALGQTSSPPPPLGGTRLLPLATEDGRAFVALVEPMTLDEAKMLISHAEPPQLSLGSVGALADFGMEQRERNPQKALTLFEEANEIAVRLGDMRVSAVLLGSEAKAYQAARDFPQAFDAFSQSLAALKRTNASAQEIGTVFLARSKLQMEAGDMEGAASDGEAALESLQQAGNKLGMGYAMMQLGEIASELGQFGKARGALAGALTVGREEKALSLEGRTLDLLADAYIKQASYPLARTYALQAVDALKRAHSPLLLSSALVNLSAADLALSRVSEALATAQRAAALVSEETSPLNFVSTLGTLGSVYEAKNDLPVALDNYRRAIAASTKWKFINDSLELEDAISHVLFAMGRFDEAHSHAETGLLVARKIGADYSIFLLSKDAGRVEAATGDYDGARAYFQESIRALERLRQNASGSRGVRIDFFSQSDSVFGMIVNVDAKQRRWEEAFRFSEQEKGRALLDMLNNGNESLSDQLTAAETAEKKVLTLRLNGLKRQRMDAEREASADRLGFRALGSELDDAYIALSAFYDNMYAIHPDLSRRIGESKIISLRETAQFLPDSSTALLEYEVTDSATYLFVVTRGSSRDSEVPTLHGFTIPVGAKAIRARTSKFQFLLSTRDPAFDRSAAVLYRLLLGPAKAQLAGKKSFILIPSDALWNLPFQALKNSRGRYLIEEGDISYAPSLSVLSGYAAKEFTRHLGHTLLAFGDPTGNLKEAATEVRTVAKLYGPTHVQVFTRDSATKENFEANASAYDIVHLATHGVFDPQHPMASYLLLAKAKDARATESAAELGATEIADIKLSAELVVLSACETAKGKLQGGEGLIGLSWSFLAAGSQSVVASQWRVESASTTQLMIAFHRGLLQNMNKAAALRQAELTLAHSQNYAHPFYWAGFTLLGER
jgi:CHAT domain-containing protein